MLYLPHHNFTISHSFTLSLLFSIIIFICFHTFIFTFFGLGWFYLLEYLPWQSLKVAHEMEELFHCFYYPVCKSIFAFTDNYRVRRKWRVDHHWDWSSWRRRFDGCKLRKTSFLVFIYLYIFNFLVLIPVTSQFIYKCINIWYCFNHSLLVMSDSSGNFHVRTFRYWMPGDLIW